METARIEKKFFNFSRDIKPLKMFKELHCNVGLDNTKTLGNLWQYAWLVRPMKPLWNGFLRLSHKGPIPAKAAIHFEPMIDMQSSDYSCIYSTMSFVSELVRTFDQPL